MVVCLPEKRWQWFENSSFLPFSLQQPSLFGRLMLQVSKFYLVCPSLNPDNQRCSGNEPATTADALAKYHVMSVNGLMILARLEDLFPLSEEDPDLVALFTCLSSFTDSSDPWTCEASNKAALGLLEVVCRGRNLASVLSRLLQEIIKPAFAKTRNPVITQQARKAVNPLPVDVTLRSDLDGETTPWKYRDVYINTVFGWVIGSLNLVDVRSHQPKISTFILIRSTVALVCRCELASFGPTTTGPRRRLVYHL